MSKLSVSVLGQPRVEKDGVPIAFSRRKAVALLTYLAVTGEKHDRSRLAGLFWPHEDRDAARASLRRTLTALRRAVGPEWIAVEDERVGLNLSQELWLDLRQYESLVARYKKLSGEGGDDTQAMGILSEIAGLYRADFLSQFQLDSDTDFTQWQFFQAESLRRTFGSILDRLLRANVDSGELEVALSYARRRLNLDPFHEPAHRTLMRLYAAMGQRSAALRQYDDCARRLRKEMGAEPEAQTIRLLEDIRTRRPIAAVEPDAPVTDVRRRRQTPHGVPGRARRVPRWRRVAWAAGALALAGVALAVVLFLSARDGTLRLEVLPAAHRGPGQGAEVASGLDEVLAAQLLQTGGLVVTRGSARDRIGPDYRVSASVSATEGRVRVVVELVRCRDSVAVWAEMYERDVGDVLAIQAEVAREAAVAIRGALDRAGGHRSSPRKTPR